MEDDFEDEPAREDLVGRGGFGFERFGCHVLARCRIPGPHAPSECVSVEMTEDPFTEAAVEEEGDRS